MEGKSVVARLRRAVRRLVMETRVKREPGKVGYLTVEWMDPRIDPSVPYLRTNSTSRATSSTLFAVGGLFHVIFAVATQSPLTCGVVGAVLYSSFEGFIEYGEIMPVSIPC
jgi:hypothetical protein